MPWSSELRTEFSLLDGVRDLPARLRGAVVAVGNFDGMHRGHQAVLAAAIEQAHAAGRPVVALTFEPHPRSFFRPDQPLFRLTPPEVKARLMAALGLDGMIAMPFDAGLAAMEATSFVDDILVAGIGTSHVVVGWDFHFGHGRKGTPAFLAAAGVERGFGVTVVEPFSAEDGVVVSSTRVREALAGADLAEANGLLGYRWFVTGDVIHGAKRGRELGIPTANMELDPACGLAHGIYAVEFRVGGVRHPGVASFGRRPQFDHGAPLLETYLLDFSGDLYGRHAAVTFAAYLRPELKFDSVEALIERMHVDIAEARAFLSTMDRGSVLERALWGEP